jgi:hypothetical protein
MVRRNPEGILAVTTVVCMYTKEQTMANESRNKRYAAWQKAEDKAERAKKRWKRFGRNCEVSKKEFHAAREEAVAAYREYKRNK